MAMNKEREREREREREDEMGVMHVCDEVRGTMSLGVLAHVAVATLPLEPFAAELATRSPRQHSCVSSP
jgi:hypothetical protein